MKFIDSARIRRHRRILATAAVAASILVSACGCSTVDSPPGPALSVQSTETGQALADIDSPLPMPASTPVRIEIPSIGVDTNIIDLGLNADGTMQVPPDGTSAGWYTGAPTPGETGPAIIAGHVDWQGTDGVFFDLRNLQSGARIIVSRADGTRAEFSADSVEHFSKSDFPTDTVYGDIDRPGLRIITCGGSFDEQASSYTDNVIAFAELV